VEKEKSGSSWKLLDVTSTPGYLLPAVFPIFLRSGAFKGERWLSVTLPTGQNILEQIKVRCPESECYHDLKAIKLIFRSAMRDGYVTSRSTTN